MAPRNRDKDIIAVVSGDWISWAHTISAYAAFIGALLVGVSLHYHKIVQNQYYSYPIEWFPSVSATIGDRYPERSVFQLLVAVCSGPRFILVALFYCLTKRPDSSLPEFIAGVGVFRTLTCGGWTYITSTDDHDWHDICMIGYLVATLPWTAGCLVLSPPNPVAIKYRKWLSGTFFGAIIPLVYFYIQHKVHRVPGAYTNYAFFEWTLVFLDVAFDAVTAMDFADLELVLRDTKVSPRGDTSDVIVEKQDQQLGQLLSPRLSLKESCDAVAAVYLGFAFWTNFTSLGLMVWYFPLWYMGISGYEAAILCTISPMLLGLSPVRRWIHRYLPIAEASTIAGLVAYLIKSPRIRLFAITFAVWQGCLTWTAKWLFARRNPARLEGKICAWILGLIASSIAKFTCQTNNPLWPTMHSGNGGWNKTGILLFVLASGWTWSRRCDEVAERGAPYGKAQGPFYLASFGFGGLIFALHSLLSDSSTMILWVWEGFPIRGPMAVPHGAWTILAMSLGLFLGLYWPSISRSWVFYAAGCGGAAVLTGVKHWAGYGGALVLTVYLTAVAPMLITNTVRFAPGRTCLLGFVVYSIMVLFHVWVVAYAFVPGGPLVRERTDWVMASTMILIGCGVFSALQNTGDAAVPKSQRSSSPTPKQLARPQRKYYIYMLLVFQVWSASVAYFRFPFYDYQPYHPESKLITAGIWTVHFSIDNNMYESGRRIETLLRETELDLVGLLESDQQRIIMGNRDTTQYLAEQLGMWVDYGPGPNKNTWGAALLSKFPIVNSTHHLLPSPAGELAPAIAATVEAYGELIDVFVFHSGQEEDREDRRLQSEYMASLMGRSNRPSILLSYLIVKPKRGNYYNYAGEESGMHDIDPTDWDRWCEYILYKNIRRVGYARMSRGSITDTELQLGKFVVGSPENTSNIRVNENEVPEDMRFPPQFRGRGVRGHRYHVLKEPRYFA